MKAKVFNLLVLAGLSAVIWFVDLEYPSRYLGKAFSTFVGLSVIYLLFSILFSELVGRRIGASKARYHFRKVVSFLQAVFAGGLIVTVWVPSPEALLVAYGLLGAGVAVALQDVFKNLAGGITIFLTGTYSVGDRVEVGGKHGDVIDVGVMYTTLMELREWVSGDQSTGRLTMIPNGLVLSLPVNNYTRDNRFMWDELVVPVSYDSDWRRAREIVLSVLESETSSFSSEAQVETSEIEKKYYLAGGEAGSGVFVRLTDNWVELSARYLVDVRRRRAVSSEMHRRILEAFEKEKGVRVASATMEVSVSGK